MHACIYAHARASYKQSTPVDSFANSGDVLALAFRPDGKELVTSALGGLLHFWDVRIYLLLLFAVVDC